MSLATTTTLNRAKLGQCEDIDDCPFPPLTKEQFLADIAASREDIKYGRVKDAYVAINEAFARHDY